MHKYKYLALLTLATCMALCFASCKDGSGTGEGTLIIINNSTTDVITKIQVGERSAGSTDTIHTTYDFFDSGTLNLTQGASHSLTLSSNHYQINITHTGTSSTDSEYHSDIIFVGNSGTTTLTFHNDKESEDGFSFNYN